MAKDTNAPIFPNAEILVPAAEYKYWTDTATTPGAAKRIQAVFPGWKNIKQFEGDKEVVPGVRAIATPGHTPGHTSYQVELRQPAADRARRRHQHSGADREEPGLARGVRLGCAAGRGEPAQDLRPRHRRQGHASPATTTACPAPARSRRTARATPSCPSRPDSRTALGCMPASSSRARDNEGAAPTRGAFSLPAGGDGEGAGGGARQDAAGARDRRRRGHALCPPRPAGAAAAHRRATRAGRRRSPSRPIAAWRAALWPRGLARVPQGGGDLGARMQRIFDRARAGPRGDRRHRRSGHHAGAHRAGVSPARAATMPSSGPPRTAATGWSGCGGGRACCVLC